MSASPPPAPRPVFDAHVDSLQLALDLGRDLAVEGAGQLDLERGRRGGLGAVVLVAWTDPSFVDAPGGAPGRAAALLGEMHRLLERAPERVRFAGDGDGLRAARADGAIAAIGGIEGGHAIEESLELLEWLFERGARVMTLVWNNHLSWIRSCRDGAGADVPAGLSAFGREVVRAMNRLGMVVDLSHAGERAFFDALEASAKPVIASHSGCAAVNAHPRNLTDGQIRELAAADGVLGVVFCTPFLDAEAAAEERALRATAEYRSIRAATETELNLLQGRFLQERARPLSVERVADHVLHAVEVAGAAHVGLGSDFDGIQRTPAGLEDASCYGRLAAVLAERGLSGAELDLVLGGSFERVYAAVTGPGTRACGAPLVPLAPGEAPPRGRRPSGRAAAELGPPTASSPRSG